MASNETTDPASPMGPGAGEPERTKAEDLVRTGSEPEPDPDEGSDSGSGSAPGSGSGSGSGGEVEPTRGTKEPPPDPPIGTPPPRG